MSAVISFRDFRNLRSLNKVITHHAQRTHASAELTRRARQSLIHELLSGRSSAVAVAIATSVLSGRSMALFTESAS